MTMNKTKGNLLKVAREIIDSAGVDAVSMREIGKLLGLSRSAIYRHFKSKEALLAAIVVENFIMLNQMIGLLDNKDGDSKKYLSKLLLKYYDFALSNEQHYKLMFTTKWNNEAYPQIQEAALAIYKKLVLVVTAADSQKNKDSKLYLKKTAIIYAFIHGLVELHLSGHTENAKGLNSAKPLINEMLDRIV